MKRNTPKSAAVRTHTARKPVEIRELALTAVSGGAMPEILNVPGQ